MIMVLGMGAILSGIAVGVLMWAVVGGITERQRIAGRLYRPREAQEGAGAWVDRAVGWLLPRQVIRRHQEQYAQRLAASWIRLSWAQFILVNVILGTAGFLVGTLYLRNIVAGVGMAIFGVWMPGQLMASGAAIERNRKNEQLQMALQHFAMAYRDTNQVATAFLQAAIELPYPIRRVFERSGRRLHLGERADRVLTDLEVELQHPYAAIFANACRRVLEDQTTAALFDKVAYQVNMYRIRLEQTRAATARGRTMGVILNTAAPLAYLINTRVQPTTHEAFTRVGIGRGIMVLMVVGALVTFALNDYLSQAQ